MFFVLSGFLITSVLIKEHTATGRIRIGRFYFRRVLRLAPALIVLLLGIACGFIIFNPEDFHKTLMDMVLTLGYVINWARAFNFYEPYILGHLWSLSIEEQFYLVWPAALVLMLVRIRSRRRILWILAAGIGASWALRAIMIAGHIGPERICFGSDTRADGLLTGCLAAVALDSGFLSRGTRIGNALIRLLPFAAPAAVIGILGIGLVAQSKSTVTLLVWLPIVYVSAAILVLDISLGAGNIISRFFALRPVVWVGSISYGVYLWNYPVSIYYQLLRLPWWAVFCCSIITTIIAAAFSYYLIELRLLRYKARFQPASRVLT
jgi:peptidoglycan/LPS O-acetylase OafA/YrhL